jgi:hypothetical protein
MTGGMYMPLQDEADRARNDAQAYGQTLIAAEVVGVGAGVAVQVAFWQVSATGKAIVLASGAAATLVESQQAVSDFQKGNNSGAALHAGMAGVSGVTTKVGLRQAIGAGSILRTIPPLPVEHAPLPQVQINRRIGNAASDAIALREAGIREGYFETVGGVRMVDVVSLADEVIAIESKVGRTSLHSRVRQELARDWWLLRQGQVDKVVWEFSPNAAGELGPTGPLKQMLENLGIETRINIP